MALRDSIHSVAYSPDGKELITTNHDGKGRIWDIATGKVRAFGVIMLFYLLICTFEEPNTRHGLRDYVNYCIGLFVP